MRCQEHSAQHIRKSESDSGRLNFKIYLLFLACHLPIASVILVGQMNKMRDHFLIYTLRHCCIWVHPCPSDLLLEVQTHPMCCQEHSAQHIRKSESDSGTLNFKSICCFWPATSQSLLWSWSDRWLRRENISEFSVRRCYIWVHPFFLWFTAGSLDTSDALSRTFCATYSQDRIRFKNVKFD